MDKHLGPGVVRASAAVLGVSEETISDLETASSFKVIMLCIENLHKARGTVSPAQWHAGCRRGGQGDLESHQFVHR